MSEAPALQALLVRRAAALLPETFDISIPIYSLAYDRIMLFMI